MDEQNAPQSTLDQVREHRETVAGGSAPPQEKEEGLPPGAEPIQAEAATPPSDADEGNQEAPEGVAQAPAQKIRIGDQEFNSQEEAFKYAERLEREKLVSEAYAQGLKDHIEQGQTQIAQPEPEPDNFDEEFYTNPKQTLAKYKDRARDEALQIIRQENQVERLWSEFFSEYPDLDGQREMGQFVLTQNPDIGNMKNIKTAKKLLAAKMREIFTDWADKNKTRVALPNVSGTTGPAGGARTATQKGVTPNAEPKKPSTFMDQVLSLRKV